MHYHQKLCIAGTLHPSDGKNIRGMDYTFIMSNFRVADSSFGVNIAIFNEWSFVDETFGNHLLYHTSNNKQNSIPQERLVKVANYFGQLQTVIEVARGERNKALPPFLAKQPLNNGQVENLRISFL